MLHHVGMTSLNCYGHDMYAWYQCWFCSSKGVCEIDWYSCKQTSSSTENARYELIKLLKIDGIGQQKFVSRWDNINFIEKTRANINKIYTWVSKFTVSCTLWERVNWKMWHYYATRIFSKCFTYVLLTFCRYTQDNKTAIWGL